MSTSNDSAQDPAERSFWKRCSSCKSEIAFGALHFVCSVSTCNRKRTGMKFCSVPCWEVHLPMMRHREAYAEEERAPSKDAWLREQRAEAEAQESSARRRTVVAPAAKSSTSMDDEILVVASKLKKYIRERSGMNTSDTLLPVLSAHLRVLANQAIRHAAQDGRKTVMDRDLAMPSQRDED
ncbi:hypothetical protein [Haliangium ochraceum]|uniref:Uncharacterized protein n=1 Tax=Haliangium ochraceum (strain DSM 14365 / JCM 11303 / SMP-2) TaxID=502025 RepID=D0LYE7_HALO1|nr:hypothetical protein [Haliangium ochraceum]ACY16297.1 conserved hypothetical protein [Haliangium ochraceum DSM 14365]